MTEGNKEGNVDVLDCTRAAFLSSPPTPVLSSSHFKLSTLTIPFLMFGVAEESLSALVSALGSVIFLVL